MTGAAAGILPDKLEPANNPNHRKFVHSLTFYVILIWLILKIVNKKDMEPIGKSLATSGLISYGSHILIDSTTAKSIPII
ncbi:MAG: metal-dependent hydrolase [Bacteroidales bacterium]|nr:metal-dependent hydrolase [Bacteroidales bacterium]